MAGGRTGDSETASGIVAWAELHLLDTVSSADYKPSEQADPWETGMLP